MINLLSIVVMAAALPPTRPSSLFVMMDHIDPISDLVSVPGPNADQIFGGANSNFNAAVSDDFFMVGSAVNHVAMAFETTPGLQVSQIQGWQLTFWRSSIGARGSNVTFTNPAGLVIGATFYPAAKILLAPGSVFCSAITGTGANGPAYLADMSGLNIALPPNKPYWVMAVPILPASAGQIYTLHNPHPMVLGNGTANDDWWVNPGNGFGLGTSLQTGGNAAFEVN